MCKARHAAWRAQRAYEAAAPASVRTRCWPATSPALPPTAAGTPGTPGAQLNGTAQTPVHPNLQAFKAAALDIVREYFDSGEHTPLHAALSIWSGRLSRVIKLHQQLRSPAAPAPMRGCLRRGGSVSALARCWQARLHTCRPHMCRPHRRWNCLPHLFVCVAPPLRRRRG